MLEESLAGPLGHPINLGEYRGLRPWGFALGPTTIPAVDEDSSSLAAQGLTVGLDPLASLRAWKPVVSVEVDRLRVDLHRNAEGRYWTFGPNSGPGDPPNLELRYGLRNPADIVLADAGERFRIEGHGSVGLLERSFTTRSRLAWTNGGGAVDVRGSGRWDRPQLSMRTRFQSLDLARITSLASSAEDLSVAGQLNGDLRLQWSDQHLGCRGGLSLDDLAISTTADADPVVSERLALSCQDDTITLGPTQVRSGAISASFGGSLILGDSFDLQGSLRREGLNEGVALAVTGPWQSPLWTVQGRLDRLVDGPWTEPVLFSSRLRTPWSGEGMQRVDLKELSLEAGATRLELGGQVFPQLSIRSRVFEAAPSFWSGSPVLRELLGTAGSVQGDLRLDGTLGTPQLRLGLQQESSPLLDRWTLRSSWSAEDGLVRVDSFDSPPLQARLEWPVTMAGGGLQSGDLEADLTLSHFDLDRLSGLLGVELGGQASMRGRVSGPLSDLQPDLALEIDHPRVAAVRLPEQWDGRLNGTVRSVLSLNLAAVNPSSAARLKATLAPGTRSGSLRLDRQDGSLTMRGTSGMVRWQASQFPLDGLQVQSQASTRFDPVVGALTGAGSLALDPLSLDGSVQLEAPSYRGIRVAEIEAKAGLRNNRFQLSGLLTPDTEDDSSVSVELTGQPGGALQGGLAARALDLPWLLDAARQLQQQDLLDGEAPGLAADLGRFVIDTFGGGLDGQLQALEQSKRALEAFDKANPRQDMAIDDLDGRLDADLTFAGPGIDQISIDLKAKGHLWITSDGRDRPLQLEPFVATIQGPLSNGDGVFSLEDIPVGLLALFAPVPASLRGAAGLRGRYRFTEDGPDIEAQLLLDETSIAATPLTLERDALQFDSTGLTLDLALASQGASEPVSIVGTVPVDAEAPLELTIEAHGDALRFLTALAGPDLEVTRGTTDLRLLLRGTLANPQANGFVVVRNGVLSFQSQELRQLNASLFFDFNRLVVMEGSGQLAAGGTIEAAGALSLLQPVEQEEQLTITISKARIRQPKADFQADGSFELSGSFTQPELQGELAINQGTIRPQEGFLSRPKSRPEEPVVPASAGNTGIQNALGLQPQPVTLSSLIEDQWDFKEPLVLLGPAAQTPSTDPLQALMPNLSALRFRNFRLRFGPDLRVEMVPMVSFRGSGQLLLNGPLDPSLQVRGLVRLLNGRLSLFSSTFRLDSSAANVAVFTPSLGLVPYVDIAMQTRVSDTVQQGGDTSTTSANVFDTNGSGALEAGGQLRLVKVSVQASGPANRLPDNLILRGSPPMPEAQLLALIGGNSLAGLAGGGSAALATVLGQTLLSPVLGNLTDVMGDRLQIALYPTYVNPEVKESERTSGRVPPTFTLVTEFGVDVTDNFDFSVLVAPNNTDVPPQASVSYQVTPTTTVTGSMDTNGTWQSQLQLFFRF